MMRYFNWLTVLVFIQISPAARVAMSVYCKRLWASFFCKVACKYWQRLRFFRLVRVLVKIIFVSFCENSLVAAFGVVFIDLFADFSRRIWQHGTRVDRYISSN